jgi:oxygen-dependent protoporphyrinogen oxidase
MKTVILGGGLSGLGAAWYLRKKNPNASITLLEKEARLGGWIETKTENGFCFERGPRTLARARSPLLLELIEELGLSSQLLSSCPDANRRFLFKKGSLRSIRSFWPTLLIGALREICTSSRAVSLQDESIEAFAKRRFGSKIAHLIFDPMTLGIYAGDIQKLSIRSCFQKFWEWERTDRSIVLKMITMKKGLSGLVTLQGGLETLIQELIRQLPIEIVTDCRVDSIGSKIVTSKGTFDADRVISALPAYEISRLTDVPLHLPYRSIWVVHLGFLQRHLKQKGFGYLVPSQEKKNLLGMVWDSEIFAGEEKTRLTAMLREESTHPVQDALDALRHHLKIDAAPDYVSSHFALQAIPQFEIGHEERMIVFEREVKKKFPSLLLAGNYFTGASLEACLERSRYLVKNAGIFIIPTL